MNLRIRNSAKRNLNLLRELHEVNESYAKVVDFGPRKEYIRPILVIKDKTICKVNSIQDVIKNWPGDYAPVRLIWREDTFILDLQIMGIPIPDGNGTIACSVKGYAKLDGKVVAKIEATSGIDVIFDDTPRPPVIITRYLLNRIEENDQEALKQSAPAQSN